MTQQKITRPLKPILLRVMLQRGHVYAERGKGAKENAKFAGASRNEVNPGAAHVKMGRPRETEGVWREEVLMFFLRNMSIMNRP